MRKDVKLGLAVSLVVIVVAAWYSAGDKETGKEIPLSDEQSTAMAPQTREEALVDRLVTPDPQNRSDAEAGREHLAGDTPSRFSDRMEDDVEGAVAQGEDQQVGPAMSLLSARDPDQGAADVAPPPIPRGFTFEGPDEEDVIAAAEEAETVPVAPSAEVPADSASVDRPAQAGDAVETYTVKKGDTFAVLAEIFYGSQRHMNFLIRANPQVHNPNRLLAGTVINIPPLPEDADAPAVAVSGPAADEVVKASDSSTYVVQKNDTFYSIAKRVLGNAGKWKELYELNKELVGGDPTTLRPGQVLKLPKE